MKTQSTCNIDVKRNSVNKEFSGQKSLVNIVAITLHKAYITFKMWF